MERKEMNPPAAETAPRGNDETRWKCSECDAIFPDSEWLKAPNPFEPAEELYGCPSCKNVNCAERACDEPECKRTVTCGWPTLRGYRTTCGDHYVASAVCKPDECGTGA
jgi:hypothetical protein